MEPKNKFSRITVSIQRTLKKKLLLVHHKGVSQNILQTIPFWIASVITGLVAVLYARAFLLAERGTLVIYQYHAWLLFILTPGCFIISWWLVNKFAPYSRGSGIPQVMASIELTDPKRSPLIQKLLSVRIIIIKIVSSLIVVLGGAVIGREGPTIQVAGSIFQKINTLLPSWAPRFSKKSIIIAGAASGLAAAFNAPLGGIVFAVEELSKTHINTFKSALFTAVIIAGLTARALAGPYLYLGYPNLNNLGSLALLGVLIVTVIAGLCAAIMSRIIIRLLKRYSSLVQKPKQIYFVIACSLMIALAGFFFGQNVLGSGKDLITEILFSAHKRMHWYIPLLRMNGLIFSFATGTSGGIFAPSLSAGAGIGAIVAGWFHFSATDTNMLILSGMVAFLTGVTRSPFTCAVLVLEMTDGNNIIFQLMFAGMFANILASFIDRHSIYEYLKRQYLQEILKQEKENNSTVAT